VNMMGEYSLKVWEFRCSHGLVGSLVGKRISPDRLGPRKALRPGEFKRCFHGFHDSLRETCCGPPLAQRGFVGAGAVSWRLFAAGGLPAAPTEITHAHPISG